MRDNEKIEGAVILKKGVIKEQVMDQLKQYAFSGIKLTFVEFRQFSDTWEDRLEMHISEQDQAIDKKKVEDILGLLRYCIDDGSLDYMMRNEEFIRYIYDRKTCSWRYELGRIMRIS